MGGILFHVPDAGYDWGSFTGDDFTGDNGDPVNSDYWTGEALSGNPGYDNWEIQNNQLYVRQSSTNNYRMISKFNISGDFDIQLRWIEDSFPDASTSYIYYFYFQAVVDNDNYMQARRGWNLRHFDQTNGEKGGVYFSDLEERNSTNSGYRIKRVGSTWTSYRYLAGDYTTQMHQVTGMSTSSIIIRIGCYGAAGTSTRSINYPEFEITAGTVAVIE